MVYIECALEIILICYRFDIVMYVWHATFQSCAKRPKQFDVYPTLTGPIP